MASHSRSYTYAGTAKTKLTVTINTTATSIVNNTTTERVVVKFVHTGSSWTSNKYTANLNFNGTARTKSFNYSGAGTITLWDFSQTVKHNNDGTKTANLKITDNRNNSPYTTTISVNANFVLDNIPRYTSFSKYTLSGTSLTNLKVDWGTNHTVDRVQYKIGSGDWINGYDNTTGAKSGSFNITGRNPNTSYSITIRSRRKDSQLYNNSSAKSAKTKDIARLTSIPDNIEFDKPFTVTFDKNGASNVWLGIYDTTGSKGFAIHRTVTGSSYTFDLTDAEINGLYNDMTTVNSKNYRIYIATNDNTYRDSVTRKLVIKNANPEHSIFTYEDTNPVTLNLTESNQDLIKNYSNLMVDVNSAVPKKGASINSYILTVGNKTVNRNDAGELKINNVADSIIRLKVVDSRGNSFERTIKANMIDYSRPNINLFELDRQSGATDNTHFILRGTYDRVDFGKETNDIVKVEYRYKTTGNYGSWYNITNKVIVGGTTQGSFNNLSDALLLFSFGISHDVEVRVTDKISNQVMTTTVDEGFFVAHVDNDFKSVGFGIPARPEYNAIDFKDNVYIDDVKIKDRIDEKINRKFPPRAETTNLNFNKTEEEWGSVRYDIVTNQVTQGKPEGDGFVTTYFWDNSGNYDSQLHIPNNNTSSRLPQWRSRGNDDEWGEWRSFGTEFVQIGLKGNFGQDSGTGTFRINNLIRSLYNTTKISVSDNAFTITSDINYIEISATFMIRLFTATTSGCVVRLYKNNVAVTEVSHVDYISRGNLKMDIAVPVKKGDVFKFNWEDKSYTYDYIVGDSSLRGEPSVIKIKVLG